MDRLLLRAEEAAGALGVSRATVYRLMREGDLASVRIGGCRRLGPALLAALATVGR
jgi:excisionase family DNA binding protein